MFITHVFGMVLFKYLTNILKENEQKYIEHLKYWIYVYFMFSDNNIPL
jgi:hypothetical protein